MLHEYVTGGNSLEPSACVIYWSNQILRDRRAG
jgi:hypothetical protein